MKTFTVGKELAVIERVPHNGHIIISGGPIYRRIYIGYSEKEAIKEYREEARYEQRRDVCI